MSNTFFIADLHFGHKKVIEFEKEHRPFSTIEEHDEELVRRWNARVSKKDSVSTSAGSLYVSLKT